MSDLMAAFAQLSCRFGGVDLQRRNASDAAWPAPWRARLITNKVERAEYRITVHGPTWSEAITQLIAAVAVVDAAGDERAKQRRAIESEREP